MIDTLPKKACSTADCLISFRQHGGDIDVLAQFTKAPRNTVRQWNKDRLPLAETLLRLQYFLSMLDYNVDEFKDINPVLIKLGHCIALDLVSSDDVVRDTGFHDTKNLLACLRGTAGISSAKLEIIKGICIKNNSLLSGAITAFRMKHCPGSNMQSYSELIIQFSKACEQVRLLGNQLLDGPIEGRIEMRKTMGQGSYEPPLQLTWEVLNKLLKEPFIRIQ